MKTLGIVLLVLIAASTGICSLGFLPGVTDHEFGGAVAMFVVPGLLVSGGCCYWLYRIIRKKP